MGIERQLDLHCAGESIARGGKAEEKGITFATDFCSTPCRHCCTQDRIVGIYNFCHDITVMLLPKQC